MNDVLLNLDKAMELIKTNWKKKPSKATFINWCREKSMGVKVKGEWWAYQDALELFINDPKIRKRYGIAPQLVTYDN